jgi:hypothetical protein
MNSDHDPGAPTDSSRRTFLKQASIVATVHFAAKPSQTATMHFAAKPSQTGRSKFAKAPWMTELGKQPDYALYAQLPDGRLMRIFDVRVDGRIRIVEGVQETAARYSRDDGYSWSEAETLFKLPKEKGQWGLSNILLDHDGEMHIFYQLFYTVGEGKEVVDNITGNIRRSSIYDQRYDVWHVRSTDGRKNWKAPNPVWQGYAGSMLSVIQLRNGRIVLPLCVLTRRSWSNPGEGFDAFTDVGRFSSKVVYSDDGGESWHLSPVEFKTSMPYIGADGMIEPIVIQLKDGRVWMLIRTPNGRFYDSFSKNGAEWSHPQPTRILSSDSPAALVRLKDGRIVMLWNNCLRFPYAQGGRHVIHAAISEDEAQSWRGYREVARDPRVNEPHPPDGDYGVAYTQPDVTKDQKVIFTTESDGKPALLHFDPEWLYETDRRTDFSDGLKDWSYFGTKGVEVVPNPEKPGGQALQLRKPESDWPAAAVWNFPMGRRGHLRLKLLLNPGFAGVRLGLTDHFSVPFDPEDRIYNLYNLEIGSNGELASGKKLEPGRWHNLEFDWDCAVGESRVTADGRPIAALRLTREAAAGVSYLRLVSTAEKTDKAGLLVKSVDADVSQSWRK